jgi:2-polyprenyl-6-methoxyphenol hydroxylase-like FAD-dependent oxidoreductase
MILIVGGGPTGLGLALSLAHRKIPSIVIERRNWPVEKVCGEGVMPAGAKILERLGVLEHLKMSFPFKGVTYIGDSGPLKPIHGHFKNQHGLGIRRLQLSEALHQTSLEHPDFIDLFPQTDLIDINENGVVTVNIAGNIQSKGPFSLIVGCDGIHSRVKKLAKLESNPPGKQKRLGCRLHFALKPWTDMVEVWWGDGIEAYVTPVGVNEIEIAFIWDLEMLNPLLSGLGPFWGSIKFFPELKSKVEGALQTSKVQSFGPLAHQASKAFKGRVLLMGDAYFFLDGITGEGISLGLKQGELLAKHLQRKINSNKDLNLKSYDMKLKRSLWRHLILTHLALYLTRHPNFREKILFILRKFPGIFNLFLKK